MGREKLSGGTQLWRLPDPLLSVIRMFLYVSHDESQSIILTPLTLSFSNASKDSPFQGRPFFFSTISSDASRQGNGLRQRVSSTLLLTKTLDVLRSCLTHLSSCET